MIIVLIRMNSTLSFGPGNWGLAVIAAAFHYASTMGSKAEFLFQGTKTRNQLITNDPPSFRTAP